MDGKVVLITGTTSGTGSVAAYEVARLGGSVCCLNRPSERSAKALAKLIEEFPEADIKQIDMDLSTYIVLACGGSCIICLIGVVNFESVRKGIEEIKATYEKVNVVCCNAGEFS